MVPVECYERYCKTLKLSNKLSRYNFQSEEFPFSLRRFNATLTCRLIGADSWTFQIRGLDKDGGGVQSIRRKSGEAVLRYTGGDGDLMLTFTGGCRRRRCGYCTISHRWTVRLGVNRFSIFSTSDKIVALVLKLKDQTNRSLLEPRGSKSNKRPFSGSLIVLQHVHGTHQLDRLRSKGETLTHGLSLEPLSPEFVLDGCSFVVPAL